MPDQKRMVTLVQVQNSTKASLIRSILKGSGIESFIPDEIFGTIYGGTLGIRIQVRTEDLEKAKEVLEKIES
jgi:hypothetical protein